MQSVLQSREHWLIITGDEEAPEKPNLASILCRKILKMSIRMYQD
jgi:hypothetical protein